MRKFMCKETDEVIGEETNIEEKPVEEAIPKNGEELVELIIGDSNAMSTLQDPALVDYYKRYENREILINQDIDDGIVEWTQQIIEWNKEDKDKPISERKPITIYINSNGGSLNAIMELITMCNLSKTPVKGIGMAKCYSAGGLLLMGIPKGNRYILSTTEALIHDGTTGSMGDTGKVIDDLEYTKRVEEKTKHFILSHSTISESDFDRNYRRNWWMDAEEIINNGLADHIIKDIEELF